MRFLALSCENAMPPRSIPVRQRAHRRGARRDCEGIGDSPASYRGVGRRSDADDCAVLIRDAVKGALDKILAGLVLQLGSLRDAAWTNVLREPARTGS